ncbi:MAG: hypothetical protein ACOCXG_01895 [Nanoarchaeota archaeon]
MANNIFGGSKDPKKDGMQEKVDSQSKAVLNLFQRQKDIESSLDLLGEKIELVDHNTINNFKKSFADIKELRENIREIKQELETIREFNSKLSKQLKIIATKDEVSKLEKYIDFWDPMNFVTREEMHENNKKQVQALKEVIQKILLE